MPDSQRFPYTGANNSLGEVIYRPLLSVVMIYGKQSIQASELVDSGADVNVLPHGLGNALGLVWDEQRYAIHLTGNLANYEAPAVVVSAQVGELSAVNLAFAWTQAEQAPLIFGHTNLFEAFDICFFRTESYFSVTQRASSAE